MNLRADDCCGPQKSDPALSAFMFDGIIDAPRFKPTVGPLIEKARAASSNGEVRVFGEMVDLIWRPNPQATQRLEELWNQVIKLHSVPLLCAYSLGGSRPEVFPESLLECHSEAPWHSSSLSASIGSHLRANSPSPAPVVYFHIWSPSCP